MIGIADEIKGTVPVGLVVLKAGIHADAATLQCELVARIRDEVGPVAGFHRCLIVQRLPMRRSRSGGWTSPAALLASAAGSLVDLRQW